MCCGLVAQDRFPMAERYMTERRASTRSQTRRGYDHRIAPVASNMTAQLAGMAEW